MVEDVGRVVGFRLDDDAVLLGDPLARPVPELTVLSFDLSVRWDADGAVLVDSRTEGSLPQPGTAAWSSSFPPHTLENVGTSDIHVIGDELKSG